MHGYRYLGIEMEAMTAVSVAALTIYDMCKAVDLRMQIGAIRLTYKSGGKIGRRTPRDPVAAGASSLLSVETALARILDGLAPRTARHVPLAQANGEYWHPILSRRSACQHMICSSWTAMPCALRIACPAPR